MNFKRILLLYIPALPVGEGFFLTLPTLHLWFYRVGCFQSTPSCILTYEK